MPRPKLRNDATQISGSPTVLQFVTFNKSLLAFADFITHHT